MLADTSSSIKDLNAVRRTVREIVQSLRPQDRVRLLCVDVAARPLHEGWLKPDEASALKPLDQEFCLGKTDLAACLRQAVQEFPASDGPRRRLVIYVGDGADEAAPVLEAFGRRVLPEWLEPSQAVFVSVARAADGFEDGLSARTGRVQRRHLVRRGRRRSSSRFP